jgi:hypothetical protein
MRPHIKRLSIRVTLWLFVIITLLCLSSTVNAFDDDTASSVKKWYQQAKENYENLPDHGKFATGAVCGYGASKLVVNSGQLMLVFVFGPLCTCCIFNQQLIVF